MFCAQAHRLGRERTPQRSSTTVIGVLLPTDHDACGIAGHQRVCAAMRLPAA